MLHEVVNSVMSHSEEAAARRFFFRKENRLLKRADFLRVYGQGKVYRRGLVHVFVVAETPGVSSSVSAEPAVVLPTRIGITATRKTGNSVKRSRARRLVREAFRRNLPDIKPGFSMVVNVTRATSGADFQRVNGQLVAIWKEAGVL